MADFVDEDKSRQRSFRFFVEPHCLDERRGIMGDFEGKGEFPKEGLDPGEG